MGVAITELLTKNEISISDLSGKTIAIDTSMFLYQFLTTIRQADGTPLMDSKGNVTSHISGIFSRSINFMSKGIKLVYVFDGKPPELKEKERKRRSELKKEAAVKYKAAVEKQDIEEMRKYAGRSTKITPEIVEETKELISALGIPYVDAPSEAEAQASFMVNQNDCYAVGTQDADVLMFGANKVIRNLSSLGKRKKVDALSYKTLKPEMIDLTEVLNNLGIDNDQLIALCMLVGTDYNIGGIKGIGPKNALKLVKKHGNDIDRLFKEVKWNESFDYGWNEVFYLIKKMPTTDDYSLNWNDINIDKINEILVEKHDFSAERINNSIDKIRDVLKQRSQKSLFDY